MRSSLLRFGLAALALLLAPIAVAVADSDEDAVRQLLMKTFDRPDAQLAVDPIVVSSDHAVADWTQEKLGGRALLKRKAGQWMIVLCSGDGIKSADAMRQAGVPPSDAAQLALSLETSEKSMSAERRALLATFDGTVMMGTDGAHPPADTGASGGHHSVGR